MNKINVLLIFGIIILCVLIYLVYNKQEHFQEDTTSASSNTTPSSNGSIDIATRNFLKTLTNSLQNNPNSAGPTG